MKGLVKYAAEPGNMEVREVAEPVVKPDFVKIEVMSSGICGSDLHILHSDIAIPVRPPVITGHEFSGVVVEVGDGVSNCKVGDRISSETAYGYCGTCENCKNGRYNLCDHRLTLGYWFNGAFAEYTMVPADRIHKLADNVSFKEGALLEPLACVCHATIDLARIKAGDIVLVSGPGAIGLMTLQVAKAHGATVIVSGTDIDVERLGIAQKLGADLVVNVSREKLLDLVGDLTDGRGVDVVFECSGSAPGTRTGLEAVKKYGQFVQIGLAGKPFEVDFPRICYKEIKVTGSLGSIWSSWDSAIRLVSTGKVNLKALATHEFKLEDWEEAFRTFEEKKGLKILIKTH
ncbi:zinc-dependent alcohol dehydrogenase [Sediminispirochaeta bajacaliforniensis]|uniref:zinc-dependent alcohol dehydrogenase n=1 Tax=Sediminispirochaeta bajacaliforniensis TaxID=148 RepID=UPI000366BB86|nr:zinc-binding dehydrogenase [Sediminispirochaeta bajacaliforniensis]